MSDYWQLYDDLVESGRIIEYNAKGWGVFNAMCWNCHTPLTIVAPADLPLIAFCCPRCNSNPYIVDYKTWRSKWHSK